MNLLENWLQGKPDSVKVAARKFPPGTKFNIHGKTMWTVGYQEDGTIEVSETSPYENYQKAVESREVICQCCVEKLDSLRID